MKKRTLALMAAGVMLFGVTTGGTLAWLMDSSATVTNTFTVGDINILLQEHKLDANGTSLGTDLTDKNETYKIVPGDEQPKDPFVTVEANSEDCYVFLQVKELYNTVTGNANAANYITYSVDNT